MVARNIYLLPHNNIGLLSWKKYKRENLEKVRISRIIMKPIVKCMAQIESVKFLLTNCTSYGISRFKKSLTKNINHSRSVPYKCVHRSYIDISPFHQMEIVHNNLGWWCDVIWYDVEFYKMWESVDQKPTNRRKIYLFIWPYISILKMKMFIFKK